MMLKFTNRRIGLVIYVMFSLSTFAFAETNYNRQSQGSARNIHDTSKSAFTLRYKNQHLTWYSTMHTKENFNFTKNEQGNKKINCWACGEFLCGTVGSTIITFLAGDPYSMAGGSCLASVTCVATIGELGHQNGNWLWALIGGAIGSGIGLLPWIGQQELFGNPLLFSVGSCCFLSPLGATIGYNLSRPTHVR